jgi:hypothetical protein
MSEFITKLFPDAKKNIKTPESEEEKHAFNKIIRDIKNYYKVSYNAAVYLYYRPPGLCIYE